MSDGHECRCGAAWRGECGCGADWTPQEVIDLRAEVETLKARVGEKTYRIKPLVWESRRDAYREEFWTRPPGRCYSFARTRVSVERRWTHWYLEIRDYSGNHVVGTFGYYYHRPPKMTYRTIDDAKSAAEAHWRETITRFLEEVTHE